MLFCTNVTLTAAATVNKVCAYICSCMTTFIIGFEPWQFITNVNMVLSQLSTIKMDMYKLKVVHILPKTISLRKLKYSQLFLFFVFLPIRKIYYTFTCFLDSLTYSATCHFAINGFTVRAMTTWKSSPQVVNRYEKIMHLQVI